jgi:hypothetical protein
MILTQQRQRSYGETCFTDSVYGNSYLDAPELETEPPGYEAGAIPVWAIGTVCSVTLLCCWHPQTLKVSNSQFLYCGTQSSYKVKNIALEVHNSVVIPGADSHWRNKY